MTDDFNVKNTLTQLSGWQILWLCPWETCCRWKLGYVIFSHLLWWQLYFVSRYLQPKRFTDHSTSTLMGKPLNGSKSILLLSMVKCFKNTDHIKCWHHCAARKLIHISWNIKWYNHFREYIGSLKKNVSLHLLYNLVILFLGIYPK